MVAPPLARAQEDPQATTITVHNKQAPVGGVFQVSGRTSCELTDVMLKFTRFNGSGDIAVQQTKTKPRSDGLFDYSIAYVVPADARPGGATLYADARCGDPNATPSDDVHVTITKAQIALTASPSRVPAGSNVTVTGHSCYGDDDGKVTVRAAGSMTSSATVSLSGHRFSASFVPPAGRTGVITFSVGGPDCSGSKAASMQVRLVGASRPTTAPPTTTTAPSVTPVSPTATSGRPSPSPERSWLTPSASSSLSVSAAPETPVRRGRSFPLELLLGVVAAAGGVIAFVARRS